MLFTLIQNLYILKSDTNKCFALLNYKRRKGTAERVFFISLSYTAPETFNTQGTPTRHQQRLEVKSLCAVWRTFTSDPAT